MPAPHRRQIFAQVNFVNHVLEGDRVGGVRIGGSGVVTGYAVADLDPGTAMQRELSMAAVAVGGGDDVVGEYAVVFGLSGVGYPVVAGIARDLGIAELHGHPMCARLGW